MDGIVQIQCIISSVCIAVSVHATSYTLNRTMSACIGICFGLRLTHEPTFTWVLFSIEVCELELDRLERGFFKPSDTDIVLKHPVLVGL